MGNDVSKEIRDIADMLEEDGKSFMTPTNKTTRFIQMDPRSPTEGIVRTPIEVRKVREFSNEGYLLRRRWKSEPDITPEKHDKFEEPFYNLRNDPRSPTLGITRTPIQVYYDEERACANVYGSYAKSVGDTNSEQNVALNVNVVTDCRSPSLGICRTPIQIAASHNNKEITREVSDTPLVNLSKTSNENVTSLMTWQTPLSKRLSCPFVFTDLDGAEIRGKKEIKQYEQNSVHEKENDASLKRKLAFTPEPVKTGVKVRTPLGSRNFQDSPSQLLKIMQVQKVGHEMANCMENPSGNPSLATKSIKKPHPIMEWDNKDSTIIL